MVGISSMFLIQIITLRLEQNGHHFADDIFLNENVNILILTWHPWFEGEG